MTRTLLATMALVACAACAPEPLPPVHAAQSAPEGAPAARGAAVTSAQPKSATGSIEGTVATNPYRAIKTGGVVYIEDAPRDTGTPLSATLDNHDMTFVPSIAVVSAGGSVIFTNTDPLMHNVFSPDGEKWNLGEIPQNGSVVRRFDSPGVYTVLCNLHPSMLAYLVVTPTSYVARTDDEGAYSLKNVPPGTYKVTAWAPRMKPVTQTVSVTAGDVTANFDLAR